MMPISPPMLDAVFRSVSVLLLCVAALHDVVARTIPNRVPAALALIALLSLVVAPSRHEGALTVALAFVLVFGGAVLFWRLGWLGGGDVKLLGAVGLLVPPGRIVGAVAAIGLAGGLLALPYLACRGRIARPSPGRPSSFLPRAWRVERFRLRRGGPLPYAVAIAAGTVIGLLGGPLGGPP